MARTLDIISKAKPLQKMHSLKGGGTTMGTPRSVTPGGTFLRDHRGAKEVGQLETLILFFKSHRAWILQIGIQVVKQEGTTPSPSFARQKALTHGSSESWHSRPRGRWASAKAPSLSCLNPKMKESEVIASAWISSHCSKSDRGQGN